MLDAATRNAIIDAVREAARTEVMPRFRKLVPSQIEAKSSATDLVTEADQAMEERLQSAFEELLPGVAFVGEESVASEPELIAALDRGEDAIILDPIDGTWNFAHGLATFGTLLAVADSQGTAFGLLYDPVLDDWVWAARGEGTHRKDGARFQASSVVERRDFAGSFGIVGATEPEIAHVAQLLPSFRAIAETRASIWDYWLLSEGHLSFSVSRGLNPWDHAAGALALTEAGGVARLSDGTEYSPRAREGRMIAACNDTAWNEVQNAFAAILN